MAGNGTHGEDQNQLVSTFCLGDALYGIDTMKVQEVVRVGDITRVHHAKDYILGIINLRGKIVTIIDLNTKLGMEAAAITPESRILIVGWEGEFVGLLVDRVADVVSAEKDLIAPPPSNVKGIHGRYFEGVYQTEDDELIAILNVGMVFTDEDI